MTVDSIHRVISENGQFFGVACTTTRLVTEACRRHDVGPLAAAALGRSLTGAAMLAALMKDGQSLQLKFAGNGPLRKILAEAGYDGWVRGYVAEPHAELPLVDDAIDVVGGIGRAGLLTVTKTIKEGTSYPGTIALYKSSVGEDLAYYLLQSEQTPSTLSLTVHLGADGTILAAGGFLVQALPPTDENSLNLLADRIDGLPPLSSLLAKGLSPGEILSQIFAKTPHRHLQQKELSYQCSCSLSKMEGALLSLGASDLQKLQSEQDGATTRCEYCRKSYTFSSKELQKLIDRLQTLQ